MAGAGWAALSLSDEQVPPAAPDPTSTLTPSAVGGPQDHAVAGQILGLLSDNGLLVGSDFIRDYAGIERSANGWTLIFEGDDWITVEPRFAGSQLKITDMSSAFEADTRSLIGETVFLSTRRPRFSLGPPLFDRSENAVSIQAPFVWSGPVDDGRSLRGCAFEVSDSLGPVGRSSSSLLIPPPTSEAGRDGMLEDSVALPPTLPRTRALSMNLVCSGGVGRPVHPADGCSEGIDVPGTGVREHYPPKPSFEVFNMWTGTFAGDCLHVVAGRQQDRDISGPGLQDAHYYPGGALEVFGGYTHENRTESFESTLPHPIRLVDYRRSGENVVLVVQSLADCSLGAFRLKEAIFVSTPGWAAEREYPCTTEAEKRDLPTTITYDCFHARLSRARSPSRVPTMDSTRGIWSGTPGAVYPPRARDTSSSRPSPVCIVAMGRSHSPGGSGVGMPAHSLSSELVSSTTGRGRIEPGSTTSYRAQRNRAAHSRLSAGRQPGPNVSE